MLERSLQEAGQAIYVAIQNELSDRMKGEEWKKSAKRGMHQNAMWDFGRIGLRRGRGELPKSDVRRGKGDGTKTVSTRGGRIPTRSRPNTGTRRATCDGVGGRAARENQNGTRTRRRKETRGRTNTGTGKP
jgi:hypothetical protein